MPTPATERMLAIACSISAISSVCSESFARAATATINKTNFVVLFADDMGWADLASFGHPTQEWGHLDELAETGVRFTQWYSSESICTPSRLGLNTGRLPTRMGMPHSVFSPRGSEALPLTDPTVAEMLKPYGYKSGIIGEYLASNSATLRHKTNYTIRFSTILVLHSCECVCLCLTYELFVSCLKESGTWVSTTKRRTTASTFRGIGDSILLVTSSPSRITGLAMRVDATRPSQVR